MTDYFTLYKEKKDECIECPFFRMGFNQEHQRNIYEWKGQYLKTYEYGHLKDNCLLPNIEDVLKGFIQFLDEHKYIDSTDIDINYLIEKFIE